MFGLISAALGILSGIVRGVRYVYDTYFSDSAKYTAVREQEIRMHAKEDLAKAHLDQRYKDIDDAPDQSGDDLADSLNDAWKKK